MSAAPRRGGRSRRLNIAVERLEQRLVLSITALASFAPGDGNVSVDVDSNAPRGGVALDSGGNLFGTLPQGGAHQDGSVVELAAGADTITTLASFDGANGKFPNGSLVIDGKGDLYGATAAGGAYGDGTVFEIAAASGTITTLASFDGGNGAAPNGLVADSDGNLYGSTRGGGSDNTGVVFEVVKGSGAITPLASFDGSDGMTPSGDLVVDSDGNLYGTTANEGANNFGTVFEVAHDTGIISVLASFDGNDAFTNGSLAIDGSGNLFGAANNTVSGGNVFEVAKGSGAISVVGSLASNPIGDLIVDGSGNVYGATAANRSGIDRIYLGVVFEIAEGSGHVTTLDTFDGTAGDGANSGLAIDSSGKLYGTTADGGASGNGTIFEYSASPISIGAGKLVATEGLAFSGAVAVFSDADGAGAPGDYSATIDWGDGAPAEGGAVSGPDGSGLYTVTGAHAYAEEGTFTAKVSVNREGAVGSIMPVVSVADAPLTGIGVGSAYVYVYNVDDAVAFFTDPDTADSANDYSATIDWGDGQTSAGMIATAGTPGRWQVNGQHSYTGSDNHTMTITISHGTADPVTVTSYQLAVTALTHNQAYVTAVYQDVLGRAPEAGGLAYWSKKLDSGTPRGRVAESIGKSDEYYQNFVIKPDYLKILGRAADSDGLSFWTKKMDTGTTDQQLAADLAASDEVYAKAGGTNVAWMDGLYKLLLNRTADAGGETYWIGRLAAGTSRSAVALGIAGSRENNSQLINDDYFHYLGRAADANGLAFWLAKFAKGETNEDVIAGFTAADEYYNKHTD